MSPTLLLASFAIVGVGATPALFFGHAIPASDGRRLFVPLFAPNDAKASETARNGASDDQRVAGRRPTPPNVLDTRRAHRWRQQARATAVKQLAAHVASAAEPRWAALDRQSMLTTIAMFDRDGADAYIGLASDRSVTFAANNASHF